VRIIALVSDPDDLIAQSESVSNFRRSGK